MSDFERDNEWQRGIRDTVLGPGYYGVFSYDGRYVYINKGRLAHTLQKRFAVDTIVQSKNGDALCIEEKIVRWPGYHYQTYALETHSCTKPGHESPGWMEYGQADYLLYCFVQESGDLDCRLIDFAALQKWFWPLVETFPTFGPLDTLNLSMGRKVPIAAVKASVPTWPRMVFAEKAAA